MRVGAAGCVVLFALVVGTAARASQSSGTRTEAGTVATGPVMLREFLEKSLQKERELGTETSGVAGTRQHPGMKSGDESPGLSGVIAPEALVRNVSMVVLFGAVSLIPVALLVLTAFVRISVVLALVRQALGSPQIPGNQVLTALALLLTVLVMAPVAQRVYHDAIEPYSRSSLSAEAAWKAGTNPIKTFMIDQIIRYRRQEYLWTLYDHAVPRSAGRVEPVSADEFPLRVVAPAFLLSELTTALYMGFAIYLPFLVVDLVASALLSAMGLYLLPPALVALPIKLVLFVLADGWMLVADMLMRSF